MLKWLQPHDTLAEADVHKGMLMLLLEGVFVQTMFALTTGAFLVGFALLWGASNKVIGVLAAVGPLSQILQVPSVYLVEWTRRRKALLVFASMLSRSVWLAVAVMPWFVPVVYVIPLLVGALALHWGLGAVGGCAFNSWMRDMIPEKDTSSFFAKRFAMAIGAGALVSLGGGFAVDFWGSRFEDGSGIYAILFSVAGVCGLISSFLLARTPEPQMPKREMVGLVQLVREPFHDRNYRQLLIFLGWWSFAVNLAAPFFAVYLLERLGLSMAWVLGLTVLSQFFNVTFFQLWGRLADRFTNKSVLVISGPLFIFSFLLWPFTTLPDVHTFTIPLLVLIHAVSGISTAGVSLCAWNLALKSAPYGKGASYLAVNALISGAAASISPVIAGVMADAFASEEVSLTLRLASSAGDHPEYVIPTLDLQGLDFVFLAAFVLGMYSLHRLLSVREKGEVGPSVVGQALLMEMQRALRQISTVAGVREVIVYPYALLRGAREKRKDETEGLDNQEAAGK